MTRGTTGALALAVITAAALAQPALHAEDPKPQASFRTGIDLVPLAVTVTDAANRHIKGLTANDFVVSDEGVPQLVSFFAAGRVPLDVAIVLDTSGSMGADIAIVREAACGLARSLSATDRAAVVEVKRNTHFVQTMTSDLAAVESAIRSVAAGGDTGLNNAMYVLLRDFARQRREQQEIRRQVMVVLSDGADTVSHIGFEEVLDLARRSGVSTYVISPQPRARFGMSAREYQIFDSAQYSMKALVRESGGLLFTPGKMSELRGVYMTIAAELANQYDLGYVPAGSVSDGRFRRLMVEIIGRTGVKVRTRTGYFPN